MKRFLFILCATCLGLTFGRVSAQEIRAVEPNLSDIIRVLNASGYELFCFDLGTLKEKTYRVELYLQSVDSTGAKEIRYELGTTRTFLDDTLGDPQMRRDALIDRVGVYIIPLTDSTVQAGFNLGERGASRRLNLRPIRYIQNGHSITCYAYGTLPFKIEKFEAGQDIPLVLYASYWFDPKANVCRLCGEDEADPDMSSEILKHIPHYYLFGIRLTETAD